MTSHHRRAGVVSMIAIAALTAMAALTLTTPTAVFAAADDKDAGRQACRACRHDLARPAGRRRRPRHDRHLAQEHAQTHQEAAPLLRPLGTALDPAEAQGTYFSGKGVTSQAVDSDEDTWAEYMVGYPRLWYKQTQEFSFGFDLPSLAPGEVGFARVEDAYVYLCWYGHGADRGTVRAILPPGFEPITREGQQPTVEPSADGVVMTAPAGKDPSLYYACTEAFQPDRYETTRLGGGDGQGLVTVAAWPGGTAWTSYVVDEVKTARPWLEEQLRMPLPLGELTFREVSTQGRLSSLMSDRMPRDGVIGIVEDDLVSGVVAERLARTWFGADHISDPWLAEGLAMWAGRTAVGLGCPVPMIGDAGPTEPLVTEDGAVGPEMPGLDAWIEPVLGESPFADWQRSRYQSAVTCGIVETAAEAIGTDAMSDIIAGLLGSPPPAGAADWLLEIALASDAETLEAIRTSIAEAGITA